MTSSACRLFQLLLRMDFSSFFFSTLENNSCLLCVCACMPLCTYTHTYEYMCVCECMCVYFSIICSNDCCFYFLSIFLLFFIVKFLQFLHLILNKFTLLCSFFILYFIVHLLVHILYLFHEIFLFYKYFLDFLFFCFPFCCNMMRVPHMSSAGTLANNTQKDDIEF